MPVEIKLYIADAKFFLMLNISIFLSIINSLSGVVFLTEFATAKSF